MPEIKGSVLYVGGFELPDRNPAAHRVLNNAKILKEIGYKVVFCGVDKEISARSTTPDIIEDFESYPLPYPTSTKKWIKQMVDISAYEELVAQLEDIKFIICYNLHAVPLAKLLKIAKRKNIRVISDCTEWYSNKFSFNPIKFIKCLDTILCMRVFQKKCDGMIAISSYLANYYSNHIKNIIVLPPLVDLSDEKYQNKKKSGDGKTTFVYSGSPSASKESLGEVVKVFNRVDNVDFKLNVVGVTKEQFYNIYGIYPNNEKMIFMGRVPHKQAIEAVKQADYSIVVRPKSRVTMAGFPTKFTEAISCGTAVIANDISDIKEYLKGGKNGYLVDEYNLGEELINILTSKEAPTVERETFNYKNYLVDFDEFLQNFK